MKLVEEVQHDSELGHGFRRPVRIQNDRQALAIWRQVEGGIRSG
jgi:hypothetical protein